MDTLTIHEWQQLHPERRLMIGRGLLDDLKQLYGQLDQQLQEKISEILLDTRRGPGELIWRAVSALEGLPKGTAADQLDLAAVSPIVSAKVGGK